MPEHIQGASPIFAPVLLLEWWKPAPKWEDLYEVSNVGNIRSRITQRFKSQHLSKKGYKMVQFHRDKVTKTCQVHGLVAERFVGARPKGLLVNHKNCMKTKNWASNLEYMTSLENTRHAMENGVYKPGTYAHQSKLDEDDVANIRELLSLGLYTTEIASLYAIHNSAISRIKNGKHKTRPKEKIAGRDFRGAGHSRVQLTEEDVLEIRSLRPAVTLKELAQRFGVALGVICDAALGNTWPHLPGARPKGEAKSGPRRAAPMLTDPLNSSPQPARPATRVCG